MGSECQRELRKDEEKQLDQLLHERAPSLRRELLACTQKGTQALVNQSNVQTRQANQRTNKQPASQPTNQATIQPTIQPINKQLSRQTNTQTNKQANEPTSKQTSKQAKKQQANSQPNKQTSAHASEQPTNQPTDQQTNKPTSANKQINHQIKKQTNCTYTRATKPSHANANQINAKSVFTIATEQVGGQGLPMSLQAVCSENVLSQTSAHGLRLHSTLRSGCLLSSQHDKDCDCYSRC